MNRYLIKSVFLSLLCILLLLPSLALPVSANSAQSWFEGSDASGAIMPDTESPIVVEHELLTFDIEEFPLSHYHEKEDYLSYNARVSAQYTFYNPSAYTVTARLFFPFGNAPMYESGYYDDTSGDYVYVDDTEKFDVTVNGEAIEKKLRYTLSPGSYQFELSEQLPLLQDGFAEADFYRPDLPVTKYTFRVEGIVTDYVSATSVAFDIPQNVENRRYYFIDQNGMHTQKDGDIRISAFIRGGDELTLYVFGEPLTELPTWTFYRDGGVEDGEEIDGEVTWIDSESTTFREFALSNRPTNSPISENDWYNAFIAELNQEVEYKNPAVVDGFYFERDFDGCLMRWYEYEITLAPGERMINTVSAPLYPSIDLSMSPDVYEYIYLLSPAKTWKSFGEIEIVVNTPYYLIESSLDGFRQTESGYTLTLDGLPEKELIFALSEGEDPEKEPSPYNWIWVLIALIIIGALLILVGIGFLIAGMIILIVRIVRKIRGY